MANKRYFRVSGECHSTRPFRSAYDWSTPSKCVRSIATLQHIGNSMAYALEMPMATTNSANTTFDCCSFHQLVLNGRRMGKVYSAKAMTHQREFEAIFMRTKCIMDATSPRDAQFFSRAHMERALARRLPEERPRQLRQSGRK